MVTVQVQRKMTTEQDGNAQGNSSSGSKQQATPSTLDNRFAVCNYDERPAQLALFLLRHAEEKTIVFCATCACVDYYSAVFAKLTKPSPGGKQQQSQQPSLISTNDANTGQPSSSSSSSSGAAAAASSSSSLSSYLPSSLHVFGFHGRMVPKKRNALYKKFVALESGGVLFCTDVAARGVDIPDVDWILQLTAPKDPSFFVVRYVTLRC